MIYRVPCRMVKIRDSPRRRGTQVVSQARDQYLSKNVMLYVFKTDFETFVSKNFRSSATQDIFRSQTVKTSSITTLDVQLFVVDVSNTVAKNTYVASLDHKLQASLCRQVCYIEFAFLFFLTGVFPTSRNFPEKCIH